MQIDDNPRDTNNFLSSFVDDWRGVRSNPRTIRNVLAKSYRSMASTVVGKALLALLNIIPIGMVVLGAMYLDDCTGQPYIGEWHEPRTTLCD